MEKQITIKDFEQAVVALDNLAIQMWNQAVANGTEKQLMADLEKDQELKNIYIALTKISL